MKNRFENLCNAKLKDTAFCNSNHILVEDLLEKVQVDNEKLFAAVEKGRETDKNSTHIILNLRVKNKVRNDS